MYRLLSRLMPGPHPFFPVLLPVSFQKDTCDIPDRFIRVSGYMELAERAGGDHDLRPRLFYLISPPAAQGCRLLGITGPDAPPEPQQIEGISTRSTTCRISSRGWSRIPCPRMRWQGS